MNSMVFSWVWSCTAVNVCVNYKNWWIKRYLRWWAASLTQILRHAALCTLWSHGTGGQTNIHSSTYCMVTWHWMSDTQTKPLKKVGLVPKSQSEHFRGEAARQKAVQLRPVWWQLGAVEHARCPGHNHWYQINGDTLLAKAGNVDDTNCHNNTCHSSYHPINTWAKSYRY